eukprot:TRINITY_DN5159_c0_g1_i1.p1 TRINITY_DN5159_c0_g1~~TRINITY_DN5159_c0_g1_i1.p1  ORF type:complete len:117 (+),score=13.51 TRINITY_DN5159_c0_g1_i1:501-851(+)
MYQDRNSGRDLDLLCLDTSTLLCNHLLLGRHRLERVPDLHGGLVGWPCFFWESDCARMFNFYECDIYEKKLEVQKERTYSHLKNSKFPVLCVDTTASQVGTRKPLGQHLDPCKSNK